MKSIWYKLIEFFILFALVPINFLFEYLILIKLILGITEFLYIIYVLLKVEKTALEFKKILVGSNFGSNH